jgi:hypothetical protein
MVRHWDGTCQVVAWVGVLRAVSRMSGVRMEEPERESRINHHPPERPRTNDRRELKILFSCQLYHGRVDLARF